MHSVWKLPEKHLLMWLMPCIKVISEDMQSRPDDLYKTGNGYKFISKCCFISKCIHQSTIKQTAYKLRHTLSLLKGIWCVSMLYASQKILCCLTELKLNRGYPSTKKMDSSRWQHQSKLVITAELGAFGRYGNFRFWEKQYRTPTFRKALT